MKKSHLIFSLIALTPAGTSQIADSTESFLQDQIAGFLDSLVVTEISTNIDILMFIILPFVGMYGVTLYLTRKSLQIAEANFTDTGRGSASLSDQAKKTTQLISVTISAISVSQFGGFTPVIVLSLSLLSVFFLINNFYGAFQETRYRGNRTGDEEATQATDEVDRAEDELERRERRALETEDEDELTRTDAELEHVEEALQREAEVIENLEDQEDEDLEDLIDRMERLLKHRRQELRVLDLFEEFNRKSEAIRRDVLGPVSDSTLQEYEKVFLDYYSKNKDIDGKKFLEEWWKDSDKSKVIMNNNLEGVDTGDIRKKFRNENIYDEIEKMHDHLEEMIKFEKNQMQEIKNDKHRLSDDLDRQEEIFRVTRKFLSEVDRLNDDRSRLESIHEKMGQVSLEEVEGVKLRELRSHIEKMKQKQNQIDKIASHLEKMEGEEINLTRKIDDRRSLHDTAQREFSTWLLITDIGHRNGQIPQKGKFSDKVTQTLHTLRLFNIYMTVLKERLEDERKGEKNLEELIHRIHGLADKNLKSLSERR